MQYRLECFERGLSPCSCDFIPKNWRSHRKAIGIFGHYESSYANTKLSKAAHHDVQVVKRKRPLEWHQVCTRECLEHRLYQDYRSETQEKSTYREMSDSENDQCSTYSHENFVNDKMRKFSSTSLKPTTDGTLRAQGNSQDDVRPPLSAQPSSSINSARVCSSSINNSVSSSSSINIDSTKRKREPLHYKTMSGTTGGAGVEDEMIASLPLVRGTYTLSPIPQQQNRSVMAKVSQCSIHYALPQPHATISSTEAANIDTLSSLDCNQQGENEYPMTPFPVRRLFSDISEEKRPRMTETPTNIGLRERSRAPIVIARVRNQFRRLYVKPRIPRIPRISLLPRLRRRIMYIRLSPNQQQQRWLIPSQHPFKILWDFLTVLISLINAYATHVAITDRSIGSSHSWQQFCQVWFVVDILLNFVTEHKLTRSRSNSATSFSPTETKGTKDGDDIVLTNCQAVWARYLTSWFVVDLLSLVPGEALFVKPIIEQQKKRGFIKRHLFRIGAVVRFVRRGFLRPKHITMFSTVAKHTKRAGMGGAKHLLRLMIKYIPKYLLFLRKMKGLLALRVLRQFHWFHKVWYSLWSISKSYQQHRSGHQRLNTTYSWHSNENPCAKRHDDETISLTCEQDDDDTYFDGYIDQKDNMTTYTFSTPEGNDSTSTVPSSCLNQDCQVILIAPNDSWKILNENDDDDSVEMHRDFDDEESEDEGGYPY